MGATSVNQSDLKNNRVLAADLLTTDQIDSAVEQTLASTLFVDIHTHLFSPTFGKLGLWGIDELLTYHYLEAEFFRSSKTTPEQYWKLSKRERADAIWRALFVENSPISESTRGIIAVLQAFDLPTDASALEEAREFFNAQSIEQHIRKVFEIAGVSDVVMTNDPLDPEEQPVWLKGDQDHEQFHAVLRLDRILWGWPKHWQQLASQGYAVDEKASGKSIGEVRRFLADWHKRMRPLYMAVFPTGAVFYPDGHLTRQTLGEAVLPSSREFGLPMSLVIGGRGQVNTRFRLPRASAGRDRAPAPAKLS